MMFPEMAKDLSCLLWRGYTENADDIIKGHKKRGSVSEASFFIL